MTSITVTTSESEFQNIRMDNKYYVDKSLLIKDILSDGVSGSYLFIRPRRFGKSMNLSMLDAFFNIKYKGNNWFDGLEISEYKEYERYKNSYPVIRLDFGDVYAESWDDFLSDVGSAISEAYVDNSDLINDHTSPLFLETYQRITRGDYDDRTLKTSLGRLALELRTQYGNRAVVLIDEYDAPLTRSIGKDISNRVTGFLSNLYSDILKGNKDVQMAYITGVSRVMHQGFFSGLNNMIVDDAFSTMSGERFGFTESEVRELLGYYGASDKFEEVREWYDGYRFGGVDVYNPFSVMSYIRCGFVPSDYWIGTSSDSILRWVLERIDVSRVLDMSQVLVGGSTDLTLSSRISLKNMAIPEGWHIFYVLVEMGYLKAIHKEGKVYSLSVPNREVMGDIEEEVTEVIGLNHEVIDDLVNSLTSMDDKTMMDCLNILLNDQTFFNLTDERYYAAVLVTALKPLCRRYRIFSELENGDGRVDVFILPNIEGMEPIIIEIKRVDDMDGMGSAMDHAFDQIHKRKYYQGIRGDAILVGMVFCGKSALVRSNRVHVGRCDSIEPYIDS